MSALKGASKLCRQRIQNECIRLSSTAIAINGGSSKKCLYYIVKRNMTPATIKMNNLLRLSSSAPASTGSFSGKYLSYTVKRNVAVIKMDNPTSPVNFLNLPLKAELQEVFREIDSRPEIKGVVLTSGKVGSFIAGAEIDMIASYDNVPELVELSKHGHSMTYDIEKCSRPVVCAINGVCLGGGLEVALSTHYRMAINTKSVEVGLPETCLGILPGGGGTQRLPRYAGIKNSLDLMTSGRSVKVDDALKMGIIDETVEPKSPGTKEEGVRSMEYLEEVAINTALDLASGKKKLDRERCLENLPPNFGLKKGEDKVKDKIFEDFKKGVLKATKGKYPSPPRIVDVVKAGQDKGFKEGLEAEALGFAELALTPAAKGLFSVFFMKTALKRNKFAKEKFTPVKNLGVIGAGVMGAGIIQVSSKYNCILMDSSKEGLLRGNRQVTDPILKKIQNNKISEAEGQKLISNVSYQLDYKGFEKCNLVIENVFEDIELKKKVLQEVEKIIPENCVYATNTSAISITKIAEASKRPENVIGMHYSSPVDLMPFCEIIVTDKTSKVTAAAAIDVALKQGKEVIVVKDGPGFYTTRTLSVMMGETMRLLQEGVSPQLIDKVTSDFGFPVGLCTLADDVGLDGMGNIYKILSQAFGERFVGGSSKLIDEAVAAGHKGRKVGKGIFIYEKGSKEGERPFNPPVMDIIGKYKIQPKGSLTEEDILFRVLTRFVNESVMCLEESIIATPMDGDGGAIFAMGFPAYTGGPFRYLDSFGVNKFVEKMKVFEQAYGSSYTPCKMLQDFAKDPSKKFYPVKK